MSKTLEKAVHLSREADLPGDARRIYFGNEFCTRLIPDARAARRWWEFSRSRSQELTLLTPPVTDAELSRLRPTLAALDKLGGTEVVFSDWGVFELMRSGFPTLRPVLGRMLARQAKDPRLAAILLNTQERRRIKGPDASEVEAVPKKVPATFRKHCRNVMANAPEFQAFLLREGICRMELDYPLWGLDLRIDRRIGVSLHLPFAHLTTSRTCGKLTMTYAACRRECGDYHVELLDRPGARILGVGNSVFYEVRPPSRRQLLEMGIDRVVWQPELRF